MRAFAYDASAYNASIWECAHSHRIACERISHASCKHLHMLFGRLPCPLCAHSHEMRAHALACARIACECAHLRGTYACPVLYFTQLLTLVGAWTLLIMGSMCTFSRILWYFKILQIHWLVLGPALFTTLQPTICDESWSYLDSH